MVNEDDKNKIPCTGNQGFPYLPSKEPYRNSYPLAYIFTLVEGSPALIHLGTTKGDIKDHQFPRDVILCDNDNRKASLHWVPYVHFGA